jgi:hypothetical protein
MYFGGVRIQAVLVAGKKNPRYIGFTIDKDGVVCEYTGPLPTRSAALHAVKKNRSWLSGGAVVRTSRANLFDPNARYGLRESYTCFC